MLKYYRRNIITFICAVTTAIILIRSVDDWTIIPGAIALGILIGLASTKG